MTSCGTFQLDCLAQNAARRLHSGSTELLPMICCAPGRSGLFFCPLPCWQQIPARCGLHLARRWVPCSRWGLMARPTQQLDCCMIGHCEQLASWIPSRWVA